MTAYETSLRFQGFVAANNAAADLADLHLYLAGIGRAGIAAVLVRGADDPLIRALERRWWQPA